MYKIYTVKEGETLDSISNQIGISVEELRRINNLPFNYTFKADEQIIVPNKNNESFFYYTVENGDTIYGIARKNNIEPNLLLQINGLNANDYIYPGEKIMIPASGVKTYIVLPNDTLNSVLTKLNTNIDKLIKENEIYLMPNQLLILKER